MNATAFIIDKNNDLTALTRTDYDSEDLFQKLLADHPALLGLATGEDGSLLLVAREALVPDALDAAGRWSLDHLFLDRQGVPVLVEVKRAVDTRTRREVVAQMLDYAANGVAFWPIEQIVTAVRVNTPKDQNPDARLQAFLGDGADVDAFWRQVESNLGSGRIRMVFVADRIPRELRRIVEFLNEQMRPAEVLAIEVEQFTTSDGVRLLTPKLVGATERAKTAKAVQPAKPGISEEEWLSVLAERYGESAAAEAKLSLDWFRSRGLAVGVTTSQEAIQAALVRPDGKLTWTFFVRMSTGKLETALQYLQYNPAFADERVRLQILDEFKALPDAWIASPKSTGWPSIPLAALAKQGVWDSFVKIAEGIIARNAGQI
jgi:hypothetical protein